MNPAAILKKSSSLEGLLSTHEMEATPNDMNASKELLPRFTLMEQISECHSEVRTREVDKILSKISKLQEDVNKLSDVLDSTSNLSKNLKVLVDCSRQLVHLINHRSKSGSIPMQREQHEQFLQIVKISSWLVSDEKNLVAIITNWPEVLSVLKSISDIYRGIADMLDYNIGEHHLLQQNTTKLLEQMSKLDLS